MKRLHLKTFEETIAQMYVALGKEVNKYRKEVISDTPLHVTTGSVTSFRKGHESLKSRTGSPSNASGFESSTCQSPQEATAQYADDENYPIWIILPNNVVSLDSPDALNEVTDRETLQYIYTLYTCIGIAIYI